MISVVAPPIDADQAIAYALPIEIPKVPPNIDMSDATTEPTAGPAGVKRSATKTVVAYISFGKCGKY